MLEVNALKENNKIFIANKINIANECGSIFRIRFPTENNFNGRMQYKQFY